MKNAFLKFFGEQDFSELHEVMKNMAMNGLRSALLENAAEIEFLKTHSVDSLIFKDSLVVHLTGKYASPVLEMRMEIYDIHGDHIGYYRYLTDLEMKFMDEFLVSF
jgi:hypothetical protein